MFAAGASARDEARALKDADVLGHGVERDAERDGYLGHTGLTRRQPCQDGATGLIGQCDKQVVETLGGQRVLHSTFLVNIERSVNSSQPFLTALLATYG